MASNSAFLRTGLTGVAGLRGMLQGLSAEMQQTILGEAVNAAAQPIVKAAKQLAPRRTGALKRSIGAAVRKPRKSSTAYAVVGPMRGYFKDGARLARGADNRGADSPSHYAHLVEYGHIKVKPEKGATLREPKKKKAGWKKASSVGFVPPQPFLRPALTIAAMPSGSEFNNAVIRGIDKAIAKLQRRQANRR